MKEHEQGSTLPAVSEGTLPLYALPSSHGEKATSSALQARAAADAFAGPHAEVVDAASVYGELPLELRLMALGLSSAVVATERDGDQADRVAA